MSAENTGAVPTVKLPKAVMRQKEQTDKWTEEQKALKEGFDKETPTGNQTVQPSQPDSTPTNVQPVVVEPAVSVQGNAQTVTEPEKDAKYWEHRLKTSQGMFEAEKTRLKGKISELETKLSGVDARFKDLEDKLRATERQVPRVIDANKYLSQEQIEAYGPELVQALLKAADDRARDGASEIADRRISQEIERHVAPVKEKLDNTERQLQSNKEDAFWEVLESKVPDWIRINDRADFHDWLSRKDSVSGFVRQELLTHAQKAFDAERVVALFEAFKQSSPAPTTQVSPTQSRVVPDPVGQTLIATQTTPDIPYVKTSEINRFYTDCKLGKYRYRPQEKADMERKIRAAADAMRVIRDSN